ncbi:hypothetical protein OTU49_004520, partial [Cherax quadricarinatus]
MVDTLSEVARRAHSSRAKLLVMGDFNHREIDWENLEPHGGSETWRAKMLDVVLENLMHQHVKDTTRVRWEDEPARLDLVFTLGSSDIEDITCESPLGASDHVVLCFEYIVELQVERVTGVECEKPDYKRGDYIGLRNFLQEVPWDRELAGKPVNEMMEYVTTKCKEAVERFIPKGNRNNEKTRTSPWFTRRCKEAKTKCNREWKKYRRQRTHENREISHRARNEYAQVRREAQRQYGNNIASKIMTDPKLLYSHIRRKTTVKDQVIRLRAEGVELTRNDQEVCEELNRRFKEVFTVETGRALGRQHRREHQMGIYQQVLDDIRTTEEKVQKLLSDLDTSKLMGLDISPWVLREGAEMLCMPLTTIFNTSLETGQLPEKWNTANVVPIFKKGNRNEALNYR